MADELPIEVLSHILSFCGTSDVKDASLVCKKWYRASLDPRLQKNLVLTVNASVSENTHLSGLTTRSGFHLSITDIDGSLNAEDVLRSCHELLSQKLLSLNLKGSNITEMSLVQILEKCDNLTSLDLSCCNSLLLSGHILLRNFNKIHLPKLTALNLSSQNHLTDATLAAFLSMTPNLESLDLSSSPIMFGSIPIYGTDPNELSSAVLTFGRVVLQIKKLHKTLHTLHLSRTNITDEALDILATVEGLQLSSLSLRQCKEITNRGIDALLTHQRLNFIDLGYNTQLSDGVVRIISQHLDDVNYLNLHKIRINESAMRFFSKIAADKLNISGCLHDDIPATLREDVFKKWGQMCRSLDLGQNAGLSNKTFASLCNSMRNLTELNLHSCFHLNDASVREISRNLRGLTSLSLAWCRKISDFGLFGIVEENFSNESPPQCRCSRACEHQGKNPYFTYCPPVKDIAPADLIPSKDQIFEALAQLEKDQPYPLCLLTKLAHLDLSSCPKLTDSSLSKVLQFPSLKTLNLSMCIRITDSSLAAIAVNNPLLESINLDDCQGITDVGVGSLLRSCRRLRQLHLANCTKITDQTITAIIKQRKRLKYIDISYCNISLKAIDQLERLVPSLRAIHKRYTTT